LSRIGIRVGPTLNARFVERPNRFTIWARVGGRRLPCYLPNPGRMVELLQPGARVLLREVGRRPGRKTGYDVVGAYEDDVKVCIDTRMANRLVQKSLLRKGLPEFRGYRRVKAEFTYGRSRFDFLLDGGRGRCLLEVKSCTLVTHGRALFPDAVTERGRRHALHLAEALKEGYRCSILFVIQRGDASVLSPNDATDPAFGEALRHAAREGVEVLAYRSKWGADYMSLKERVRVELEPPSSPGLTSY